MRFIAPLVCPDLNSLNLGLPHPVRSAYRLSQPHSGLHFKSVWGLVSCPYHLWGFTLKVFPLGAASHPHRMQLLWIQKHFFSGRITAGRWRPDSRIVLARKLIRLDECRYIKVFIRPQVRSHPTLVLPSVGGRYSLGFFVPSRAYYQVTPAMRLPLMHLSTTDNKRPYLQQCYVLQSIENHPTSSQIIKGIPEGLSIMKYLQPL